VFFNSVKNITCVKS